MKSLEILQNYLTSNHAYTRISEVSIKQRKKSLIQSGGDTKDLRSHGNPARRKVPA